MLAVSPLENPSDLPEGFGLVKLKDLGPRLPIGVLNGSVLLKDFAVRELDFPRNKALGHFKLRNEGKHPSLVVTKLISLLLSKLGGEPFEHDIATTPDVESEAKDMFRISKLYMADVIYMYVYMRVKELGHKLQYPFAHEACGFVGNAEYDLDDLQVVTCNDPAALLVPFELVHGVRWRDGVVKKKGYVKPMQWFDMESPEAAVAQTESTLLKLHFVAKSVLFEQEVKTKEGMKLVQVPPDEVELGSLRHIDIERIMRSVNQLNLGPRLVADGKCVKCKQDFFQPVDWSYDNFFSESSLP